MWAGFDNFLVIFSLEDIIPVFAGRGEENHEYPFMIDGIWSEV
jgi:hypothetical protein